MAGRADVAAALAEQRRKQMEHQTSAPGMPFGGIKERGNVLPFGQDEYGRNVFAQPQMFRDLVDAVTLPGDVVAGRREPNIPDVTNLAMALTVGASGGSAPAGALRSGAARSGKGFRAYHGSPHDFDRFDMSKIGTGEGNQAFGHGLYFADAEGVARSYRDDLSGALFDDPAKVTNAMYDALKPLSDGDVLFRGMKISKEELGNMVKTSLYGDGPNKHFDWGDLPATLRTDIDNRLKGHMYEVNINADPADFLDWDKPLREQPESIRRRLGWTPEAEAQFNAARSADDDALLAALTGDSDYTPANLRPPEGIPSLSATGADIVKGNSVFDRASDALTAQRLRDAGIPGIRYFDQNSRAAGEGSRNYVVFDDSLIEILRKYGLAGAAVAGAATGMGVGDARADDALSAAMEDYIRRQQNGNR